MIRDDFKRRSQVKVISENTGRARTLRTYRFDNILESIEVPYSSWANLDCCGGWCFDKEYLDTAVQKGLKLFAGRTTLLRHQYIPHAPTLEDAKQQFEALVKELPYGVIADVESTAYDPNCFYTFVCRTGRISDHIDLDMVFRFYEKLGHNIASTEKDEIERFSSCEIKQYGYPTAPFCYTRASTNAELITTGLLLGYPIESTVSILQGH